MGLLSYFKRTSASSPATESVDDVQRLRVRARQRLVGAAVLIGVGVIGFPLLFETSPRPIPVDIPIEIARKDQAAPLALPPARTPATQAPPRSAPVEPAASEPAKAVPSESRPAATPPAPAAPAASAVAAAPAKPVPLKAEKPAATLAAADATRARTLLEGKDAKPAAAKKDEPAAGSGRFAVQVGAFADAAAAREVRQKVEKLGLKTYTQALDTPAGHRIRVRVGPYGSRDEAEKAAAKVKTAGLPTSIVPL